MAKEYNINFNYNMDIVLDDIDLEAIEGNEKEYVKDLFYNELKYIFHQNYDMAEYFSIVDEKEIGESEIDLYRIV